jgi:hypothetical protein
MLDVLMDSYTKQNIERRKLEQLFYRISRIGRNSYLSLFQGVETEEIYMRYNYTPYYTSFDMCSLLLSLFNMKSGAGPIFEIPILNELGGSIIDFLKSYPSLDKSRLVIDERCLGLLEFFSKYINPDVNKLKEIIRTYNIATSTGGDFGNLILPVLSTTTEYTNDIFIHNVDALIIPPYINQLYLSPINKICLSIPFVPEPRQIAIIKRMIFNSYITMFTVNESNTILLYNTLIPPIKIDDNILIGLRKNIVEYNVDYLADGFKGFTGWVEPKRIIKTNRYSKNTYIYDYDTLPLEIIANIYTYIQNTVNRKIEKKRIDKL